MPTGLKFVLLFFQMEAAQRFKAAEVPQPVEAGSTMTAPTAEVIEEEDEEDVDASGVGVRAGGVVGGGGVWAGRALGGAATEAGRPRSWTWRHIVYCGNTGGLGGGKTPCPVGHDLRPSASAPTVASCSSSPTPPRWERWPQVPGR